MNRTIILHCILIPLVNVSPLPMRLYTYIDRQKHITQSIISFSLPFWKWIKFTNWSWNEELNKGRIYHFIDDILAREQDVHNYIENYRMYKWIYFPKLQNPGKPSHLSVNDTQKFAACQRC